MTEESPISERSDRLVWIVIAVAVVVFWMVATSGRPWELFSRAGFSSDFYDEQARVLLRGRLAVDPAVPGPEGFLIGDSTYLYYGPFLAVVRMPFMLFGDLFVGRLVRVSMLIALVVLGRWSFRLSRLARIVVGSGAAGPWPPVVFVAAVMFSPALFASGWVSVYNETELWALTLAVITITLTAEWAASNFSDRRTLVLAALAALAAALTRAPIGFGVALALGVCGIVLLGRTTPAGRAPAVIAIVGGLLPLIVHAGVNRAKFGTWMSVPGDRQLLSLTDPVRAAWFERTGGSFFSVRFLPTTLAQYWRPDAVRFERLVPGVRFGPLAPDYGSLPVEASTPASSLTTSALLLLVLAIGGLIWLTRHRAKTWTLLVTTTAVGAIPTFCIGFIANRYLIDMLPPLIAAGAVGVWVLAALPHRRLLQVGAAVLTVWGVWVNTSLAVWNVGLKAPGFTEARYAIDDVAFGATLGLAPPGLWVVDDETELGRDAPRDGIVGVLADCSAVYIAEQGHWVALDRASGIRATAGELRGGRQLLAAGTAWTLEHESRPDGNLVTFTDVVGDASFVWPLPDDNDDTYDVVVDSVTGEFTADVGGDAFFLPADVVRGTVDLRPDQSLPVARSELCASLTD